MNPEIQTFNFNNATIRTLTDTAGDPWFAAKDACDVLGLNNVSQTLTRLDNDEKNSIILNDGTPGTPTKAIIPESGLYSLTIASRKPEAHEFEAGDKITRKGLALLHRRLGETRLCETLETTTH